MQEIKEVKKDRKKETSLSSSSSFFSKEDGKRFHSTSGVPKSVCFLRTGLGGWWEPFVLSLSHRDHNRSGLSVLFFCLYFSALRGWFCLLFLVVVSIFFFFRVLKPAFCEIFLSVPSISRLTLTAKRPWPTRMAITRQCHSSWLALSLACRLPR